MSDLLVSGQTICKGAILLTPLSTAFKTLRACKSEECATEGIFFYGYLVFKLPFPLANSFAILLLDFSAFKLVLGSTVVSRIK